ncbi:hypothetical protein LB577_20055 [Mesorhizobium sp. B283B1A]|uniref:hypothetical protein n=1 Tax=Mesorhizobium TaxID=68287 RepID=UPI001CD15ED3|nr:MULTISPECIES: hypothetical protein [Mesorhizobium]MCA0049216.1 hypothetical protein [Mesorhizobium sp. B283B1A]UQS64371.1 hypothetical protein M5D98_30500 [Mesorhizobium opportunistum]
MPDDDFVKAYRVGGITAVNDLLSSRFGKTGPALMRMLDRMHDSRRWDVKFHYVHGQADFGVVIAYHGDE